MVVPMGSSTTRSSAASRRPSSHLLLCACLVLLLLSERATAKSDEWFHECKGDDCGHKGVKATKDCFDKEGDQCKAFALKGECLANPVWMLANCRKSCGQCRVVSTDSEECHDLHTNCPSWAEKKECFTNPAYMAKACPESCWLCVNPDKLKTDGVDDDMIRRRLRFEQTDFGKWQSIPPENDAPVRKEVINMAKYVQALNNTGPGTVCNNQHHDCVKWKVEKDACETNKEFMLKECSLACQFCDVVSEFHMCRGKHRPAQNKLSDTKSTLESIKTKGNGIVTDLLQESGGDREIILSTNFEALTGGQTSLTDLVQLLQTSTSSIKWLDAKVETGGTDRSGQTAMCGSDCLLANPSLAILRQSIVDFLQVDPLKVEPLEFVRYGRGDRLEAHHDFDEHSHWRHSGNRALSLFAVLEPPTNGGGFGFPDLDWLVVESPNVLIWPQMMSGEPLSRMTSEQLPVIDGELLGVFVHVREYYFDENNECA